ncbi:hypothetical protein G6F56_009895 [Rhizopus delemar]|nr:hypothetical protein G6F56_009895 [Rhizopus delemar]
MSEIVTKDTNEEKLAPVELTNKYDGTQLKNAVDDEISRFYGKNKQYIQSYKHTDIKLFLGYVSCFIAGGSFYYEYKTSFREAINPSVTLKISGKMGKYTSKYPLTLTYTDSKLNKSATLKVEPNVTTWFTTKGALIRSVADSELASYVDRLQKMLHKE